MDEGGEDDTKRRKGRRRRILFSGIKTYVAMWYMWNMAHAGCGGISNGVRW